MIFSWTIQFIQANLQSSTSSFDEIIKIVIPKTDIQIWSNNMGDSIRMEPSPMILHDSADHFIGIASFACFAVFSVAPVDPTTTTYSQRPEIRLSINNSKTHFGCGDSIPVILERDLIADKSNRMCLIFIPLELFVDMFKCIDVTLNHLDDFKMKVRAKNGKGLDFGSRGAELPVLLAI
jgi:hypothetical protein